MLKDLGSRDIEFIETVSEIRQELLKVANVDAESWTTVPMQGSGTFAVEAVLQTVTPRKNGRVRKNNFPNGFKDLTTKLIIFQVLILANGAYGKRMAKVCDTCDIAYDYNLTSETMPVPLSDVKKWLTGQYKYK